MPQYLQAYSRSMDASKESMKALLSSSLSWLSSSEASSSESSSSPNLESLLASATSNTYLGITELREIKS